MGEISTVSKNSTQFSSLKTVIPMSIVRQWEIKVGDKLDWSWYAIGEELLIVVRKQGYDHGRNTIRYDHNEAYRNEVMNQLEKAKKLRKPGFEVAPS
jgi:hypothetical protein